MDENGPSKQKMTEYIQKWAKKIEKDAANAL
jgi:hypothetical protein